MHPQPQQIHHNERHNAIHSNIAGQFGASHSPSVRSGTPEPKAKDAQSNSAAEQGYSQNILRDAYDSVRNILMGYKPNDDDTRLAINPCSTIAEFPCTFVISICLGLAVLYRRPIFLYGTLPVLLFHMASILLKWYKYIFDDPALNDFRDFLEGWSAFAMRPRIRLLPHGQGGTRKKRPIVHGHDDKV